MNQAKTHSQMNTAINIQNKAAEYDFDWKTISPVFDKLEEEIAELKQAIDEAQYEHIQSELGDILFVVANLARHLKLDPDQALQKTNTKFENRFNYVLNSLKIESFKHDHDLKTMEAQWQKSKTLFP